MGFGGVGCVVFGCFCVGVGGVWVCGGGVWWGFGVVCLGFGGAVVMGLLCCCLWVLVLLVVVFFVGVRVLGVVLFWVLFVFLLVCAQQCLGVSRCLAIVLLTLQ
ncbi:hypothetical protein, partial [Pseudomonas syringae group genomosp. 7]|uniref:hypothetical protein n=1 Tax=Pseudomonas syringae group genomosp. 7 TaxID=251699 RepID=UPI00376FDD39